ncbi:hypothetical protein [Companilactobacillus farciminis]|uniref:hypothetical protein n=1 Tax=Companilactobacillus farciminis TaxID=1612 RepID=UPI0023314B04|nr:hypothetical protein [Companilactobacillus farciminis]WCG36317.1 hypothetical protein PML84_03850 [Companilactobacillus farciminis]
MADRTNDTEVIYKKDGTKVVEGEKGSLTTAITGLAGGTVVATGDYQIAFKDSVTGLESDKVDIPGFTVESAPEQPADVKTAPTDDGAKVTAG